MLFKNRGAEKYLNRLPLIIQAMLKNIDWIIVLATAQIVVYVGIGFYIIYNLVT